MQLVEQLQVKRTEAHNRLTSRKRKLSELFAATACTGDPIHDKTNQKYLQQLQAFYDANDIQKGHRFNESTLPPRPRIVRIQLPEHVQSTNDDVPKTIKDIKRGSSPSKQALCAPLGGQIGDLKEGEAAVPTLSDQDESRKRITSPQKEQEQVQEQQRAQPDVGIVVASEISQQNDVTDAEDDRPDPSPNSDVANESKIAAAAVADASVHSHSPPVVTDRNSSPASSTRPRSNTPAVTAASPNTSPGNEVPPLDVNDGKDRKETEPHKASTQDQPTTPENKVPDSTHKSSASSIDADMMDVDSAADLISPVKSSILSPQLQQRDLANRKPPIRIDTEIGRGSTKSQSISDGTIMQSPAPITSSEPVQADPLSTSTSAVDTTKRATRISSGALQKKSVSEILGETPKVTSPRTDSPIPSANKEAFFLSSTQDRHVDRERKERERTKLSTVVFAKPLKPSDVEPADFVGKDSSEKSTAEDRDYLYTLFESKAHSSKSGNLSHLIQHSHKIITTTDHMVDYEYLAQCRVLKRLYQLQSADRWALRQRKRVEEPSRRTSHWDFLLDHAKWMRTDFREERKWKYAAARALAEACAEWVTGNAEERKMLQVQIRTPSLTNSKDADLTVDDDIALISSHPTPELLPSGEDESVSDDVADPHDILLSNAPAAIFSLGASDFTFLADKTPAFDKVINELPLYKPAEIQPDLSKSNLAERLDARWKTDIVPVSRFATERLAVKEHTTPVRQSRYDYELESSPLHKTEPLPPREENVGLFMAENKNIRDRIHPGHSFRPPSEHPMPTQAFFETRSSSQWTAAEDDELKRLVKDYSYNWSLISSCLTPRSLYSSSQDRRTPWECFERWIGLEGMPADMAKTPYFRTYSGRIEAAGRHLQAQLEEAQRRAGPSASITPRKRTTQPVRVDRKRAQRHLAMLDAMRKLAKKREVHRQKQAHSADMAAMRKSNEVNQPRLGAKTPAEWSHLKHEKEQKLAKQQELYRQQLIAHQRAATAQQQRGTVGQANGVSHGVPQAPPANGRGPPNSTQIAGMPNGQLVVANGVSRPHPPMMGMPNGMSIQNGMGMPKGIPTPMQASMRNGIGGSPQQMRLINEAQKMQQEQLLRQAQQNGSHSSPNTANAAMANGHGMNNSAFIAALANANGAPSPSGLSGNSGSPRSTTMGQALSSGHVPVLTQIAATIKERHPNMPDEEVHRHASQQLTSWQQQATAAAAGQPQRPRVNQAALNAAMGAANAAANAGMAAAAANASFPQNMTSEQLNQYNHRLRMQQAQQHAARGMPGQLQANLMGQMTNSPVMNMSRPVSQHNNQGLSRSATPREQSNGSGSNVAAVPGNSVKVSGNSTPKTGVPPQGQQFQQGPQGSPRTNVSQQMQT